MAEQFILDTIYVNGQNDITHVVLSQASDAYGHIEQEYARLGDGYRMQEFISAVPDCTADPVLLPVSDVPAVVRLLFEEARTRDGALALRDGPRRLLRDDVRVLERRVS